MRQHPQFNSRSLAYNVAVLKLAGEPEEEVDSIVVSVFVVILVELQGVFLHWAFPKKYGNPRLGESTLT